MKVIELENIDSTNAYAKSKIDILEDKTLISANKQTSGRGRLSRSWVDLGEGNLFLSIVLKPYGHTENYPNLTQYLSVCLCKVLETYELKPQIKWPNDVLIDGKKIAGILAESVMMGEKTKGIILGIGVNLNAEQKEIDAIPDKIATSLNLEINRSVDKEKFLKELSDEFFRNYDRFLEGGFPVIKNDYIKRNCFLNNKLSIQIFDKTIEGFAKSINDNGELVIVNTENKEVVLTVGDIL